MFIFFDIVLLFIFLPLSFFFSYFLVCFTSLSLMIQLWFFNLILLFFLLILTSLKLSFESHDRKVLIGRICAQRQSPAHEIGTSDFVAWGISNLIHPSLQMDLTWNAAAVCCYMLHIRHWVGFILQNSIYISAWIRFKIPGWLEPKKGLKTLDFQACEGQKVLKMLDPRNSGGAKALPATPLI